VVLRTLSEPQPTVSESGKTNVAAMTPLVKRFIFDPANEDPSSTSAPFYPPVQVHAPMPVPPPRIALRDGAQV
ncbi:hypothetical protein OC842_005477, partial [Tilletia horrida]